jgi:formate-dependent nitrite reductase membrane component NrfD
MEVSWSLVFYTLFVGLGMGAFGYVAITEWLGTAKRSRLAGSMAVKNGQIYVLQARPAWNTILWPLIYTGSAAVLGLFTMYVWTAIRKDEDERVIKGLNTGALVAVAVQAVLVIAYVIYLAMAPFQAESRSPMRLLGGDLALIFWAGVVVLGLIIPLWLTFRSRAAKTGTTFLTTATIGLLCTFVGAIAIRAIMYGLGTSIQQFL